MRYIEKLFGGDMTSTKGPASCVISVASRSA